MAVVKTDEICGLTRKGEVYCLKCAKKEGITDFTIEELLLTEDIESNEELYFCDICKKQIE
jgi:hypothetical protein